MTPTLTAVAANDPVTVDDALAWCWPTGGDDVVGFGYGVDAATWWRLTDGQPPSLTGPSGPAGLDAINDMYELVVFDRDRELRWLRNRDDRGRAGLGQAVILTEEGATLPAGTVLDREPKLTRWNTPRRHLLADHFAADHREPQDWAVLRAARYATAVVPVRIPPDLRTQPTIAVLTSVDYTVEDEHGNLTVAETRRMGLRVLTRERVMLPRPDTPAFEKEQEQR